MKLYNVCAAMIFAVVVGVSANAAVADVGAASREVLLSEQEATDALIAWATEQLEQGKTVGSVAAEALLSDAFYGQLVRSHEVRTEANRTRRTILKYVVIGGVVAVVVGGVVVLYKKFKKKEEKPVAPPVDEKAKQRRLDGDDEQLGEGDEDLIRAFEKLNKEEEAENAQPGEHHQQVLERIAKQKIAIHQQQMLRSATRALDERHKEAVAFEELDKEKAKLCKAAYDERGGELTESQRLALAGIEARREELRTQFEARKLARQQVAPKGGMASCQQDGESAANRYAELAESQFASWAEEERKNAKKGKPAASAEAAEAPRRRSVRLQERAAAEAAKQ